MGNRRRIGLVGPFALAVGGSIIIFLILEYFRLLYDGRLTFPYEESGQGITLFIGMFSLLGLFLVGLGLEMIIQDSR